jgi:hypothetical protein
MTIAQRAWELQKKINRSIDCYGEAEMSDVEEMDKLCNAFTDADTKEFLMLYAKDMGE